MRMNKLEFDAMLLVISSFIKVDKQETRKERDDSDIVNEEPQPVVTWIKIEDSINQI